MTTTIALASLAFLVAGQYGPGEPPTPPPPSVATDAPAATAADEVALPASSSAPTTAPGDDVGAATGRRPLGAVVEDTAASQAALQLETCHGYLAGDDPAAASACYRDAALRAQRGRDVRVAAALAGLADDIAARQQREASAQPNSADDIGAIVTSGKAELVLWSGLFGLWFGSLGVVSGLTLVSQFAVGWNAGPGAAAALATGALLFPVAMGVGGLALSGVASLGLDELGSGDANLIRSAMWMGVFDSIAWAVLATGAGWIPWQQPALVPVSMLLVSGMVPAAGIAASTVVDLPDGGVALANSLALWTGVLGVFGLFAAGVPLEFAPSLLLVAGTVNAAWAAGLVASPWIPLSRPETWALDLGAALGLASSAALVLALNAPNPVLGFGGMMAGTVVGGALGLGAAYLGRRALEGLSLPQLPALVVVGPTLLPTSRPWEPAAGAGLVLRF